MVQCDYCGKDEYMPFRCKYCGGYFCSEHRLPEMHNCTGNYHHNFTCNHQYNRANNHYHNNRHYRFPYGGTGVDRR